MEGSKITAMQELGRKITEADIAYFKFDEQIMSDRDYDRLVEKLKRLEKETGIILSGSPTNKVPGAILGELKSVRHSKPMLSADKTKNPDDLIRFSDGRDVVLSWKLDGLTLVLRYQNGELKQAITRGTEGLIGEDVTHTVRHFMNVPLKVPSKGAFEVRGEGVISWANFNRLNEKTGESYSHPRSVAAGSVRKLDSNDPRQKLLEFFAFELIYDDRWAVNKLSHFDFLESNGFDVVPYTYIKADAPPELKMKLMEQYDPKGYGYPVDGLIMEYADLAYGKSLGATGHHENRLIALKWEDELYKTKFLAVEPAVTRNGMVSLTAIFEPVEIDGAMVSRAYLHNIDILKSLKLGKGDTIQVYKANMIIPQIANNLTQSNTLKLPSRCPCCGEKLTVITSAGGTRQLYCQNKTCAAKLVRQFVHFCDKTRMNIEGLSEKTLTKFISKGWIHTFADLYDLERHKNEITHTEGFGLKSYQRLISSIERSRYCGLNQFIAAMGIPMVGRTAGRTLNKYFHGDWNAFEKAIQEHFDFTTLPDFGETMHKNIYAWYSDKEAETLWRPLLTKITFKKEETTMAATNQFAGKTIVATGKLQNYTRDGINEKILSLGGKPASSVSRKTDYLIVGEKPGSKLAKAKENGVTILTEQEFEKMIA